ncbi:MAG: hypothetical protein DYG96_04235 [Chlorobi bacterium CHB2]|nr:hypothetical protein [Chlorobi bacterium CHB2]
MEQRRIVPGTASIYHAKLSVWPGLIVSSRQSWGGGDVVIFAGLHSLRSGWRNRTIGATSAATVTPNNQAKE